MLSKEEIAQLFHESYERLAPMHSYETREDSAVPWDEVPSKNKSLMIEVAGEVGPRIAQAAWDAAIEAVEISVLRMHQGLGSRKEQPFADVALEDVLREIRALAGG